MASWNTKNINSTFNVNESIDSMISARESNRSDAKTESAFATVVGKNKNGRDVLEFNNLPQMSVVGINANQIPTVIDAIDSYINGINAYINEMDPNANASVAFKSEAVMQSLNTYMNNVKTYVLNLISNLRAFEDKLIDVKNQWESYAGNLSNTINETTGDNFAMGSSYQRAFQTPSAGTSGVNVGHPSSSNTNTSSTEPGN